jgi:16S rRNA processing protein RimM
MMTKSIVESDKLVPVATITAVHGIGGAVKVRAYSGDLEALAQYRTFTTSTGTLWQVKRWQLGPKTAIAHFTHLNSRTEAELLIGTELYIKAEELPRPGVNEYYYRDLIGLTVIGIDGEEVGAVTAVHNYGAGDILEIQPGSQDQSKMMIFNENNVQEVDLERRRLVIHREALV